MNVPRVLLWVLAFVIGLFLVPVHRVTFFFPLMNVTEVILFGGVCLLFAWRFRSKSWVWALLVAAPVWLDVLRMVRRLGFERMSHGIGTGHALSLVLIPLAACLGALLGRRLARRRSLGESLVGASGAN